MKVEKYRLDLKIDLPIPKYGRPGIMIIPPGIYTLVSQPNPLDSRLTPWMVVEGFWAGMTGTAWFAFENDEDMPFGDFTIEKIEE